MNDPDPLDGPSTRADPVGAYQHLGAVGLIGVVTDRGDHRSLDPRQGVLAQAGWRESVHGADMTVVGFVDETTEQFDLAVDIDRLNGIQDDLLGGTANEDSEGFIRAVGEVEEANDLVEVVHRSQGIARLRGTASYDKQSDESASGDRAQGQV